MILPSRHIKNCESLIGLASILLNLFGDKITVENLWNEFQKINNSVACPTNHSYDNFILSIDLLFLLEKVEIADDNIVKL